MSDQQDLTSVTAEQDGGGQQGPNDNGENDDAAVVGASDGGLDDQNAGEGDEADENDADAGDAGEEEAGNDQEGEGENKGDGQEADEDSDGDEGDEQPEDEPAAPVKTNTQAAAAAEASIETGSTEPATAPDKVDEPADEDPAHSDTSTTTTTTTAATEGTEKDEGTEEHQETERDSEASREEDLEEKVPSEKSDSDDGASRPNVLVRLLEFRVDLTFEEYGGGRRFLRVSTIGRTPLSKSPTDGRERFEEETFARLSPHRLLDSAPADADVREWYGIFLGDVLKSYLNDYFTREFAKRAMEGIVYADFKGVDLKLIDEEKRRGLEEQAANLPPYSATYSGLAIFALDPSEPGRPAPKSFAVQSMQHRALEDEAALLERVRSSDGTGLNKVAEVQAGMNMNGGDGSGSGGLGSSMGSSGGGNDNVGGVDLGAGGNDPLPAPTTAGSGSPNQQFDTVILVAIIVASVSLLLLAVAMLLAFRRKRMASNWGADAHSSPAGSKASNGETESPNSDPRSPPSFSNEGSSPQASGGAKLNRDFEEEDSFAGIAYRHSQGTPYSGTSGGSPAVRPLSRGPMGGMYPDDVDAGAGPNDYTESEMTDDIDRDIKDSIDAYNQYVKGYGSGGNGLDTSGMVDAMSVSSMDSSQYGYSLDGATIDSRGGY